jgi:catalase
MATTPKSSVDALNSAWGKQTTQRSAHAKGVVLLGKFVPSAEAASVSKALHFKHEVPVTVRFSANSGMPTPRRRQSRFSRRRTQPRRRS